MLSSSEVSSEVISEVSNESIANQQSENDQFLLPLVEPKSLEPIFNYVAALNLALTGDLSKLKASAVKGCGCLDIADRLEGFFPTASLVGAGYELSGIWLEKDQPKMKIFKVEINRSDITKIDKKSGARVLWSASKITNQFIVQQRGYEWQLIDTK
jgi:hypothetical protein